MTVSNSYECDVCERVLQYRKMLLLVANGLHVPPLLLAGVICQESAGDPWAARPEPYYKWVFGRRAHNVPVLKRLLPLWRTPKRDFYMQRISYGLCQIMGAVVRELGFKGYLTRLCDPYTNIFYGGKFLAKLLAKAGGDRRQALLRYNGGGDKGYPDKVEAWMARLAELAEPEALLPQKEA